MYRDRWRRLALTAALASCGSLLVAAHARAATDECSNATVCMTIGAKTSGLAPVSPGCADPGGCAAVSRSLPGRAVTAPFRAVIVRWRVRGSGYFQVFAGRYVDAETRRFVRDPGTRVRHATSS